MLPHPTPHGSPRRRQRYRVAALTASSRGPELTDVDGGKALDVSGSYGVNVCGYDVYKGFVDRAGRRRDGGAPGPRPPGAWAKTRALGPNVLGPVHPVVVDVLRALKGISNKEEVSFHMSGTRAVWSSRN